MHNSFAQNVAPVIPDLKDLTLNEDGSASVFIIATDANNDSLIYSAQVTQIKFMLSLPKHLI